MTIYSDRCLCGASLAAHYDAHNRRRSCEEALRLSGQASPALAAAGLAEIPRERVRSSAILSLGFRAYSDHESALGDMDVEFPSGAVYRYHGVPRVVYQAIRGHSSVGSAFHAVAKRYRATILIKGSKL